MRKGILSLLAAAAVIYGCREREFKLAGAEPAKIEAGTAALVTITGQGFAPGAKVFFGDRESPQTVTGSDTVLVALVPLDMPAGVSDLKVTLPDGKSGSLPGAVTIVRSLEVTRVEPGVARAGEGDGKVMVHGAGFTADLKVLFAGVPSEAVELVSDRMLSAALPAIEPGLMTVTVEAPSGARAELKDGFQLLAPDQAPSLLPFREAGAEYGAVLSVNPPEYGSGVAMGDLDGDGWLDLILVHRVGCRFFKGDGTGRLVPLLDATLPGNGSWQGGFIGDFDNDGLADIFVSGQPSQLFHNLGGFRFEEVTLRTGLSDKIQGWGASWGDYDLDGKLDLFIGSPQGDNRMYHNLGGRFEEVFTETFNVLKLAEQYENQSPTSFSTGFGDYDRDGYLDLFLALRGQPSILFHNDQGQGFSPVTKEVGIDVQAPTSGNPKGYKMSWGVAWADWNNDGWMDISSSTIGAVDFFQNQEGKSFQNVVTKTRAQYPVRGLAPAWGDFDNDGYQDLALTDNSSRGVSLYQNKGDGTFEDITDLAGISSHTLLSSMGVSFGDLNRDGALDLYIVQYLEPGLLFMGAPYPGRHFLEIELKGAAANALAIGAEVTLQSGGTVLTRAVSGGESYLSQPSPVLHFGLGSMTRVEKLTIKWPGGPAQTIENPAVDQVLTVTQEGERKSDPLPPPLPAPEPGGTAAPAPGATP